MSAICQRWASDIDRSTSPSAPHGSTYRRGEMDEEGVEMWVPVSEDTRRKQ